LKVGESDIGRSWEKIDIMNVEIKEILIRDIQWAIKMFNEKTIYDINLEGQTMAQETKQVKQKL
jgi:hypothetical protein